LQRSTPTRCQQSHEVLSSHLRIGKTHFIKELDRNPFFEIYKPIDGIVIKDEIDLDAFLYKLGKSTKLTNVNKNIYVQIFQEDRNSMLHDQNDPALLKESTEDYEDQEKSKVHREIMAKFAKNQLMDTTHKIKEIDFIIRAGLPRAIANDIDIEARMKIERIFPWLQKYNTLCFKKRMTTLRRMIIFPSNDNYFAYMQDMKKLKEFDETYQPELGSRIKIMNKGKFVLRIESKIFDYFEHQIQSIIYKDELEFFVRAMVNRKDLNLISGYQSSQTLRNCASKIMKLLGQRAIELPEKQKEAGEYLLTCSRGKEIVQEIVSDSRYNGKVLIVYDSWRRQLLINGEEKLKEEAEVCLLQRFTDFFKYISFDVMDLPDPRIFFQMRRKAIRIAKDFDCGFKFQQDRDPKKSYLMIISNNFDLDERIRDKDRERNRLERFTCLTEQLLKEFGLKRQKDSGKLQSSSIQGQPEEDSCRHHSHRHL